MIAECLERLRERNCGGCAREEACASMLRRLGLDSAWERRAAPPAPRGPAAGLFTGILRDIVRNIETNMRASATSPPSTAFRREAESRLEPLLAEGEVRMEGLARALGCSRQTLYRRLRAEGVTFEALLEGLRRRLACRFLREQSLSVKETAYRLGFADPAAFSRAFKRWTGRSPRAWRDGA